MQNFMFSNLENHLINVICYMIFKITKHEIKMKIKSK